MVCLVLIEIFTVVKTCYEGGGGGLLLLSANDLIVGDLAMLEFFHTSFALVEVFTGICGCVIELYVYCDDLAVNIC